MNTNTNTNTNTGSNAAADFGRDLLNRAQNNETSSNTGGFNDPNAYGTQDSNRDNNSGRTDNYGSSNNNNYGSSTDNQYSSGNTGTGHGSSNTSNNQRDAGSLGGIAGTDRSVTDSFGRDAYGTSDRDTTGFGSSGRDTTSGSTGLNQNTGGLSSGLGDSRSNNFGSNTDDSVSSHRAGGPYNAASGNTGSGTGYGSERIDKDTYGSPDPHTGANYGHSHLSSDTPGNTGSNNYGSSDLGSNSDTYGSNDRNTGAGNYGSSDYNSNTNTGSNTTGKVGMGDKLKGGLEKLAGKVAGNPEMVARGEERRAGGDNY